MAKDKQLFVSLQPSATEFLQRAPIYCASCDINVCNATGAVIRLEDPLCRQTPFKSGKLVNA
jgi:hypothetical protein